MKLILFILIVIIFSVFSEKFKGLRNCHKKVRREKCSTEKCFEEKITECYEKALGNNWKEDIWPESLKGKYNIEDVINCQSLGFLQCSHKKCLKNFLMGCFTGKFGSAFAVDLMNNLKSKKHKTMLQELLTKKD